MSKVCSLLYTIVVSICVIDAHVESKTLSFSMEWVFRTSNLRLQTFVIQHYVFTKAFLKFLQTIAVTLKVLCSHSFNKKNFRSDANLLLRSKLSLPCCLLSVVPCDWKESDLGKSYTTFSLAFHNFIAVKYIS